MNYNSTPLPRIINSRDPITGLKLVLFSKSMRKYTANPKIPVCRSGEEHLVENYEQAKKDYFRGWVHHHRLELTLDGEFANSAIDLVNKDMYYHRPYFDLIWMRRGEHNTLHCSGDKHPMYGRTGDKGPMYGKGYLITGDKNPMYGRTGDKHPGWKGDKVTEKVKRRRRRKNANNR